MAHIDGRNRIAPRADAARRVRGRPSSGTAVEKLPQRRRVSEATRS